MTSHSLRSLVCLAGSLLLSLASVPSLWGVTISLSADRDNVIGASSFNVSGQPLNDVNFGASPITQVGTAGGAGTAGEIRGLASFDVSPLPAYASINSITLRMFYLSTNSDISGETPFNIEVHSISALNANWVEGTGTGAGGPPDNSGSNWNFQDEPLAQAWAGSNGLTTAGVDYDLAALASLNFNALPADGSAVDFVFTGSSAQLTSLIDGWIALNPGLVLFNNDATNLGENKRMFFHSSDAVDPLLHPQLIVELTLAPPVPEPSTFVLASLALGGFVARRKYARRS